MLGGETSVFGGDEISADGDVETENGDAEIALQNFLTETKLCGDGDAEIRRRQNLGLGLPVDSDPIINQHVEGTRINDEILEKLPV